MDSRIYEIWLSLACTPDSSTFAKLLDSFDSAEEIYNASEKQIRSCVGARASDCSKLLNKELDRAEKIYRFCLEKKVGIISYFDDEFPYLLKEIPTPPVLLYYRGILPDFNNDFRCAVVGTRSLSDYGRNNAFKFGYDIACAGATVVSGMAIGIDSVALAGAIAAGGRTIAFLGSGIDVCYPEQHLTLAKTIVKNGCIFTEYAPGTRPEKFNFPRRNRLISGISTATVVVEGREGSGSLITARHAKNQDRAVYAFPGNVSNEGSQVTNLLIKNGAKLCTSADDLVRDYEKEYRGIINPFGLKDKLEVNMMSVLSELRVVANTPSDDVFSPAKTYYKRENIPQTTNNTKVASPEIVLTKESREEVQESFDPAAIKLYKKIPPERIIGIEELVDSENDLRSVMKLLLKLEMGRFIVMLPGEKLKRNI